MGDRGKKVGEQPVDLLRLFVVQPMPSLIEITQPAVGTECHTGFRKLAAEETVTAAP